MLNIGHAPILLQLRQDAAVDIVEFFGLLLVPHHAAGDPSLKTRNIITRIHLAMGRIKDSAACIGTKSTDMVQGVGAGK
jgi:hypothetical protein